MSIFLFVNITVVDLNVSIFGLNMTVFVLSMAVLYIQLDMSKTFHTVILIYITVVA